MIKCPHCNYDGSDLKIGRRLPSVSVTGIPKMICSKCGREFIIDITDEWSRKVYIISKP